MGRWSRTVVVPATLAVVIVLAMWVAVWPLPAARAQAPSCIVGTWVASDLESATQALVGADVGLEITELEGELILTVMPDGSYTAEYSNARFAASISGFSVSGSVSGSIAGTYVEAGPDTVIGSVSGGTVEITASGVGVQQAFSFNVSALGGAPTSYQCDENQLTISLVATDPDTAVPITFTRVS